jgi:hypothetical protein
MSIVSKEPDLSFGLSSFIVAKILASCGIKQAIILPSKAGSQHLSIIGKPLALFGLLLGWSWTFSADEVVPGLAGCQVANVCTAC